MKYQNNINCARVSVWEIADGRENSRYSNCFNQTCTTHNSDTKSFLCYIPQIGQTNTIPIELLYMPFPYNSFHIPIFFYLSTHTHCIRNISTLTMYTATKERTMNGGAPKAVKANNKPDNECQTA